MLLWLIFSVLAAAVVIILLRSYREGCRAASRLDDERLAELAVYKDQLAEIEADLARGLIDAQQAGAARTEVARRLLARTEPAKLTASPPAAGGTSPLASPRVAGILALLVPLLGVALYLGVGSPGLPSQPHAERVARDPHHAGNVEAMVAAVEARLKEAPNDGRGWEVIAPIYFGLEKYARAAEAFANANRLLGETPERLAGFVQSEILAHDGIVTPMARAGAERLLALDGKRLDARLWLALAKEQDGALPQALEEYRSLLREVGASAALKNVVEERLRILAARQSAPSAPGAEPEIGPPVSGSGDRPQESKLGSEAEMIEAMVARLADRLKRDGRDADGWAQLMRSYRVLGRDEQAFAALRDARAALAGDAGGLGKIDAAAQELGLISKDPRPVDAGRSERDR